MATKTFELSVPNWNNSTLEKNISEILKYIIIENWFFNAVDNYSYGFRPFDSGFEGDVYGVEDEKYLSSWNITFCTPFDGENLKKLIKELLAKTCEEFQSQAVIKVFKRGMNSPCEVYEATLENGTVTFWKVFEQRAPMD